MKRFLLRLLFFLLPIAVIAIYILSNRYSLTEARIKKAFRDIGNSYNWVNKIDSVQGFIMGSSTLRYGISSSGLKNCDSNWINFSMNARDPIADYYLLEKYIFVKHPSYVLVGLDSWIHSKKYYKLLTNKNIMYPDLDARETYYSVKEDHSVVFEKIKNSPFFMNRISALLFSSDDIPGPLNNDIPPDNGSGRITVNATNFDDPNKDLFELNKYNWSDIEFSYLIKIKELCRRQNVRLIFIVPPARIDFTNSAEKKFANEYKQWWDNINSVICGEYVIGSYNALSSYNQDTIFSDIVHLKGNGQAIFTKMVKKQLANPKIITPYYPFIIDSSVGKQ